MYFREEFRDAVRILEHDLDPESQNIVTKIKKWASESNIYLWIQPYVATQKFRIIECEQLNKYFNWCIFRVRYKTRPAKK